MPPGETRDVASTRPDRLTGPVEHQRWRSYENARIRTMMLASDGRIIHNARIMSTHEQIPLVEHQHEGRAKGGHARAAKMSPAERSANAKKAADTRWSENLTEAVCGSPDRPLRIGDIEIECYVLEDGTRVITQSSFLHSLGRHRKPAGQRQMTPPMLQGRALAPFVTAEIIEKSQPITFRMPNGARAMGYNAELLPEICEIYLKARDSKKLPYNQEHVAQRAEILVRGLAHVGIIALVDEATGYQEVRARDALALILEAFIAKELQAWVRTFPDDFYRELFRLRGLEFPTATVQRPKYFGTLTNNIVYERLAPGVLDELKRVTPRDANGRPKAKYFQHLTTNIGYPKLREHLGSVVTLMKLSDDWSDFALKLDRIHPRVGHTLPLPFDDTGTGL